MFEKEIQIILKARRITDVMAQVAIEGKSLLLNNITMNSNAGDIPNEAKATDTRELIRTTQK